MYVDYSPVPNFPSSLSGKVIVIEEADRDVEAIIQMARDGGTNSIDADGNEVFWVVFADNPRRVMDFTKKALLHSIQS